MTIPEPKPNIHGSQAEREAWLRERVRRRKLPTLKRNDVERIFDQACEIYGTTRARIMSSAQDRQASGARGHICRELRKLNPIPAFETIGRLLKIHHTSVIYHCNQKEPERVEQPEQFPDESGAWAI